MCAFVKTLDFHFNKNNELREIHFSSELGLTRSFRGKKSIFSNPTFQYTSAVTCLLELSLALYFTDDYATENASLYHARPQVWYRRLFGDVSICTQTGGLFRLLPMQVRFFKDRNPLAAHELKELWKVLFGETMPRFRLRMQLEPANRILGSAVDLLKSDTRSDYDLALQLVKREARSSLSDLLMAKILHRRYYFGWEASENTLDDAREFVRSAQQADEFRDEAHSVLVDIDWASGAPSRSLDAIINYALSAQSPKALIVLASLLVNIGASEVGLAVLSTVPEKAHDNFDYLRAMVWGNLFSCNYSVTESYCRRILSVYPFDNDILWALAASLMEKGAFADAIDVLRQVEDHSCIYLCTFLGQLFRSRGYIEDSHSLLNDGGRHFFHSFDHQNGSRRELIWYMRLLSCLGDKKVDKIKRCLDHESATNGYIQFHIGFSNMECGKNRATRLAFTRAFENGFFHPWHFRMNCRMLGVPYHKFEDLTREVHFRNKSLARRLYELGLICSP